MTAPHLQELIDVYPVRLSLEESTGRVLIKGAFGHCSEPTSNKRLYSEKVMQPNFDRLKESMGKRRLFGELDHPADGKTSLKRVSHIVTELSITEDGEVLGSLEPLPTPMGDILKALAKAGCELGVSSRGRGSVVTVEGIDEVQKDYVLKTYDVVDNPASKNAFPTVTESAQVESFLESIDEEHRDELRTAFNEAAAHIDTFTLEDIKDDALRAQVSEALRLTEDEDALEDIDLGGSDNWLDENEWAVALEEKSSSKPKKIQGGHLLVVAPDDDIKTLARRLVRISVTEKYKGEKIFLSPPKTDRKNAFWFNKSDSKFHGLHANGKVMVSGYNGEVVATNVLKDWMKAGGLPVNESIEDVLKGAGFVNPDAATMTTILEAAEHDRESLKEAKVNVEQKTAEVDRLTEVVANGLVDARVELRTELTETIRAEMLADPEVAASRLVLEQVATALRPIMPSLGVDDPALQQARRDNLALSDLLKSKDFDLASAKFAHEEAEATAASTVLEAHLSEKLSGHPKADSIRKLIGPLDKLEGKVDLDARLEAAFEAMGTVASHTTAVGEEQAERITALESELDSANAALDSKSKKLLEAVALGEEIDTERTIAVIAQNIAEVAVYASRKVAGMDNAVQMLSLCEGLDSEAKVDKVIKRSIPATNGKNEIQERITARKRRSAEARLEGGEIDFAEEAGQRSRPSGIKISEGFEVDLDEAASLAGASG